MSNFIKLTCYDSDGKDKAVYIDADRIFAIMQVHPKTVNEALDWDDGKLDLRIESRIDSFTDSIYYYVQETTEEVISLIEKLTTRVKRDAVKI